MAPKRKPVRAAPAPPPRAVPRGRLPKLDPLRAAQDSARNAQVGNLKLSRAVDILRLGLETITTAEYDHRERRPVGTNDLRRIAVETLDAYSNHTGQDWRRHKLTGPSRAGDRNLDNLGDQGYAEGEEAPAGAGG